MVLKPSAGSVSAPLYNEEQDEHCQTLQSDLQQVTVGSGFLLVHDNPQPYVAAVCKQFLKEEGIDNIDWTPRSPDLNPIEHLLNINALVQIWEEIPQDTLHHLIRSIPRRCREVIQSIMSYNGGAVMAMRGKNCVAVASDLRFGIQGQMVTADFEKVFPMGERLYIGLAGLATDVQTVSQRLKFRLNLYELKEGRQIKPKTFMSMVSNLLYERRFGPYYVEPVIAGLDPKTFEPFICSLDLIGCPMVTEDFVVSGTCSEQMYGMCESLWEPEMEPDDLFETISQAMLNAVDRDAVSGMGVVVHVIEKDKITTRTLKARMD
nr:proteasome subunit beta type-3-like [Nerophis lumbriciformis]